MQILKRKKNFSYANPEAFERKNPSFFFSPFFMHLKSVDVEVAEWKLNLHFKPELRDCLLFEIPTANSKRRREKNAVELLT